MKYNLVVGDSSLDGHERTETFVVETNAKNTKQIRDAYTKGIKHCKFDIEAICAEYEADSLNKVQVDTLVNLGYQLSDYLLEQLEIPVWDGFRISSEEYTDIWLFIAHAGNPKLHFKRLDGGGELSIGGYGLYH